MLDIERPPPAVAELERQTQINEDVIRYMTVRVDEHEQGPSAMMRRSERDRERGDAATAATAVIAAAATAIAATAPRRDRDDSRRLKRKDQQHGTPIFPPPQELPLLRQGAPRIDYKDVRLLQGFVSERGKIVPSRITAVSGQEAARAGPGDQARPPSRPSSLRREIRSEQRWKSFCSRGSRSSARSATW